MTDCGITCGACPLAGLCGDPVQPAEPSTFEAYEREYTRPLSEAVARRAEQFGEAWADVTALAEARWADLVGEQAPEPKLITWAYDDSDEWREYLRDLAAADAPDVDPNEPRPEGAGCAGGCCSR